jgi:hypothetical protein
MQYIDVRWKQSNPEYPVRLVSELDGQRNEVRKLEFFASGQVGFASASGAVHGTELGEAPVPPLAEINTDAQFSGVAIESSTFEALWQQHVRNAT